MPRRDQDRRRAQKDAPDQQANKSLGRRRTVPAQRV